MKILGKQPSREKCAESGWFATDYLLDAPIDRAFILSLRLWEVLCIWIC